MVKLINQNIKFNNINVFKEFNENFILTQKTYVGKKIKYVHVSFLPLFMKLITTKYFHFFQHVDIAGCE